MKELLVGNSIHSVDMATVRQRYHQKLCHDGIVHGTAGALWREKRLAVINPFPIGIYPIREWKRPRGCL